MDGRRAPQGLDAEDRIALGLTAPRLLYLLVLSTAGWGFLASSAPPFLRIPPGLLLIAAGTAMAWGRVAGRPLDRWVVLFGTYMLRPHRSAPRHAALPVTPSAPSTDELPGEGVIDEAVLLYLPRPRSHRGGRARRVAFYSRRGGTGKSTVASELAAGIAAGVLGEGVSGPPRVALLDLDLEASTMAIAMGLDGPTLADVAAADDGDAAVIEGSLLRHPSGARVMLAPPRLQVEAGFGRAISRVLSYLDEHGYDVVIIDLGRSPDPAGVGILEMADDVFYVFAATAPGVYDLYRGVETLRRAGHREKIRYVANFCQPGIDLTEVLDDLRGSLVASLPVCDAFVAAADNHCSAVLDDLNAARMLRPLARVVTAGLVSAHQPAMAPRPGQLAGARR